MRVEPYVVLPFAVVRRWKDNPSDVQIVQYFATQDECAAFIAKQGKSALFDWEIAVHE